jgi:hypothetical protein
MLWHNRLPHGKNVIQSYGCLKRLEKFIKKTVSKNPSITSPTEYSERFKICIENGLKKKY